MGKEKEMKIFLLEDDIVFLELIEEYLISKGHDVKSYYTIEMAEEFLYEDKYDLLLLDINLPDGNSLELLDNYRKNGYMTPTIMITSITNVTSLKTAYEIGCDEFIRKPFEFEELEARINYIKKMYKIDIEENIQIEDNLIFDFKNLILIKEDKKITLPKKEAEIIKFFLSNENRIVTIDELVLSIWKYDSEPSIATIRTYIKNIRKNMGKDFIENIKGLGYKRTTY